MDEKPIAPHIPVIDKSKRDDGTFSRDKFTFDKQRDLYTCPAGKVLTTTGTIVNDEQLLYRASKRDCGDCPFKMQCCPEEPVRKIPRSIYEEARDTARTRQDRRIRAVTPRSQARRDAVRPFEAHPEARPAAAARTTGVHRTSSPWQRSPRTCVGWPSSPHNRRRSPPYVLGKGQQKMEVHSGS
jgi:hypothetical protein